MHKLNFKIQIFCRKPKTNVLYAISMVTSRSAVIFVYSSIVYQTLILFCLTFKNCLLVLL